MFTGTIVVMKSGGSEMLVGTVVEVVLAMLGRW